MRCPDCMSGDTYEDHQQRLHCFNCGQINDAFVMRYHRERYEQKFGRQLFTEVAEPGKEAGQ